MDEIKSSIFLLICVVALMSFFVYSAIKIKKQILSEGKK